MRTILSFLSLILLCSFALPWKWYNPFSIQATGNTYYVSFSGGNDANSTTQAKNPLTPWKTLSKVNALMAAGTIATGDIVLLKADDTFFDTLQLSKGITLDTFGTGARPIVTGFYTVTSWTNLGGNIYESEALPTPANVSMVTINGKPYAMGRYPNADAANGGYLNYEAHGTGYIRDVTGKPASVDNATWQSAFVVARINHFVMERTTVSSISGDTIKVSPSFASTPSDGYGYFLENDINALDQLGEWYYNTGTKKLDVYFPNGPTGFAVQVAAKNNLCEPRISNTSINNIVFKGANQYCLYNNFGGVANLTVTNCTFAQAGSACFGLTGRSGLVLYKDTILNGNNLGIGLTYHNDRAKILNCFVRDNGIFPGMYWKDANIANRMGNGICFLSQAWDAPGYYGATILNNKVLNSGYMGIFISGDSNVVKYNYVDTACTVMDDGGGIYHGNLEIYANKYEVVDSNQVFHVLGNHFGTTASVDQGEGIYFDDGSRNVLARGNTTAYNGNSGFYLHNARQCTVRGNNIYANKGRQIGFQHDHVVSVTMDSSIIKKNVLFANTSSQLLMYFGKDSSYYEAFYTYATFDSNQYCAPFKSELNVIQTNWFLKSQVNNYPLNGSTGWKVFSSQDAASTITPITMTNPAKIFFEVNTAGVAKRYGFCTPLIGVDNTNYAKKAVVNSYSSILLLQP